MTKYLLEPNQNDFKQQMNHTQRTKKWPQLMQLQSDFSFSMHISRNHTSSRKNWLSKKSGTERVFDLLWRDKSVIEIADFVFK